MNVLNKLNNAVRNATLQAMSVAGVLAITSDRAFAITLGAIAGNVTQSVQGGTTAVGAISYFAGVVIGFVAALKFKANRDNPQQTPIGTPLVLLGVAALCIYLPTTISSGGDTMFGTGGGTSAGADGNGMGSIH